MSRPSEAPHPTRRRLIDAAVTAMRRSGLSGAGINEIVRESGAPKGSVYHFFPGGKREIVQDALEAHRREIVAFIDAVLSQRRTPAEQVRALLDAFGERLEQGRYLASCPAGTVCLDLDAGLDDIRVAVAATLAAYVDAIAAHFAPLGPQRSRSFAGFVVSAIEGAYVQGRAERSSRAFSEAGDWLAKLVSER